MRIYRYPRRSAMHGAVNVWTKQWGTICFKLPNRVFGKWWPAYFYISPNGTPWASTVLLGREFSRMEKAMAKIRRALWGIGYDTAKHDPQHPAHYVKPITGMLSCEHPSIRLYEMACELMRRDHGEVPA